MIGFYNYTVWLTFAGLCSSVIGMGLAVCGRPVAAVICLMISGFCDMFDGVIARTKTDRTEEEKCFGIQLDSLSDIVCFGILPVVIGLSIGVRAWWQIGMMTLFALAGLIRLAYFNVTEETRQKASGEKRRCYLGLPITASALIVPIGCCFKPLLGSAFPVVYAVLLLCIGGLFVSPIRVKKPAMREMLAMLAVGVVLMSVLLLTKQGVMLATR